MSDLSCDNLPPVVGNATQVSICRPLETLQGLTRFDKAVDKPVLQRFEDIVKRLKDPLLTELIKTQKRFRPIAIRLLVLGADAGSAKPWIVVFCPECVSETVRKYFREKTAKRLCEPKQSGLTDLEVLVDGQALRPKANSHAPLREVTLAISVEQHRRHWTTHIKIEGVEATRCATMRGIAIVVDDKGVSSAYGLTAGHALIQDVVCDSDEFDISDGESPTDTDNEPIEVNHRQETKPTNTQHLEHRIEDTSDIQSDDSIKEVTWSGYGRVAQASFSSMACNRDWALIEDVRDSQVLKDVSRKVTERFFLDYQGSGAAHAQGSVVVACHPSLSGRLSRLPAFALLPHGVDFVRVHTMTINDNQSKLFPKSSKLPWAYETKGYLLELPAHRY